MLSSSWRKGTSSCQQHRSPKSVSNKFIIGPPCKNVSWSHMSNLQIWHGPWADAQLPSPSKCVWRWWENNQQDLANSSPCSMNIYVVADMDLLAVAKDSSWLLKPIKIQHWPESRQLVSNKNPYVPWSWINYNKMDPWTTQVEQNLTIEHYRLKLSSIRGPQQFVVSFATVT